MIEEIKQEVPVMDDIDIKILKLLQEDARKPLSEISSKIHLSLPAVSERLKKIEQSGVVRSFTAILEPEKFHKNLCAYCLIILKNKDIDGDPRLQAFLDQEDDILECCCLTGDYEYLVKIRTESTKTLEELLAKMRREVPILKATTSVVLSIKKEKVSILPSNGK
jgi:Lrp/AsnC family leucine-responsive transcriptional regulator